MAGTIIFTISDTVSGAAPTAESVAPGEPSSGGAADEPWVAPSALRWLFRYGSYLGTLVVAGIVLTDAFVWRGALDNEVLRHCVVGGIATTAFAAAGQLLVIASDINGIGSWRAALRTDAGRAFLVRIVLLAAVAVLLERDTIVDCVRRFADVAAASVAVIVTIGAAQSLRLLGNPFKLFSVAHGRFLLLKLLVLVAMLKIADVNRRRVTNQFRSDEGPPPLNAAIDVPVTTTMRAPLVQPVGCVVAGVVLRLGSTGPDFTCLQQRLNTLVPVAALSSTVFDDATKRAVQPQQATMGLNDDGEVGPPTGAALEIWPRTP